MSPERPTNGWDVLGCLIVALLLAIPGILAALSAAGGLR